MTEPTQKQILGFIEAKFGSLKLFCITARIPYKTATNGGGYLRYLAKANALEPKYYPVKAGFRNQLIKDLDGYSFKMLCASAGFDPNKGYWVLHPTKRAHPSKTNKIALILDEAAKQGLVYEQCEIFDTTNKTLTYEQYTEAQKDTSTELAVGAENQAVHATEPQEDASPVRLGAGDAKG